MFRLLLLFLTSSFLLPVFSKAQDLSGTWEGSCSGTAVKFVLVKCGDKYVGYNYDSDNMGFCKTNIEVVYNELTKKLKVTSISFIDHSFGHSQTNYSLTYYSYGNSEELRGSAFAKGVIVKVMSLGMRFPARLRRTSRATDITPFMNNALADHAASQQKDISSPASQTDSTSVTIRDTTAAEVKQLLDAGAERKNVIIKTITTTARKVIIKVYDNGVNDGDSISILHNTTVIASRMAVNLQPVSFEISLDDISTPHLVILIAHNLGAIPPNTATIEIIAGTKKYTLNASSDLTSNAAIRFIYGNE